MDEWVNEWVKESDRDRGEREIWWSHRSLSDIDCRTRWRKRRRDQFPRKRKRLGTACLNRVIAIEARSKDPKERWKDGEAKKGFIVFRWDVDPSAFRLGSPPPQHSRSRSNVRSERGHWNLLSDRSLWFFVFWQHQTLSSPRPFTRQVGLGQRYRQVQCYREKFFLQIRNEKNKPIRGISVLCCLSFRSCLGRLSFSGIINSRWISSNRSYRYVGG